MRLLCVVVVCLAAAALGGCVTTSWHQTYAHPADIAVRRPEALRLTLTNGSTVVVHRPDVRTDSIVGFAADGTSRLAFATPDVARIEVSSRHLTPGGRTARDAGVVVGVGTILLLGAAAIALVALVEAIAAPPR